MTGLRFHRRSVARAHPEAMAVLQVFKSYPGGMEPTTKLQQQVSKISSKEMPNAANSMV